ncbi:MAG: type II toxin-antitoxin system RelE/ParE family toxin [Segetibacter sp.]
MIVSIRHKGLWLYYEEGKTSKLAADQLGKISRILTASNAVSSEDDIKELGTGIHKLTGDLKHFWSIKITANYQIIFRFVAGDVYDIDYIDYH